MDRSKNPLRDPTATNERLGDHPTPVPASCSRGARDQPWCPSCSAPLQGRSCKLRCLRCGYFEDCSNLI